jgi:hypothetical protein
VHGTCCEQAGRGFRIWPWCTSHFQRGVQLAVECPDERCDVHVNEQSPGQIVHALTKRDVNSSPKCTWATAEVFGSTSTVSRTTATSPITPTCWCRACLMSAGVCVQMKLDHGLKVSERR